MLGVINVIDYFKDNFRFKLIYLLSTCSSVYVVYVHHNVLCVIIAIIVLFFFLQFYLKF